MKICKNSICYNYHDNEWRKIIKKSEFEDVIKLGFKLNNKYIKTIKIIFKTD